MDSDIYIKASQIIKSDEKTKEFANLNNITIEAARIILEKILKNPEMADEYKKYIFSNDRSEDFKGYTAGEAAGYQRGHDAGFAKGVAATLGAAALAGLAIVFNRR